jgi:hypothetical protein
VPIESEDQLRRAIGGERPDRPPVAPLFYFFAAANAGMSCAELVRRPSSYRVAMERLWEDFGPWDVYSPINAVDRDMMALAMPMKTAYPGDELPDDTQMQFLEEELMRPEDYDWLLEPLLPLDPRAFRQQLRRELRAWLRDRLRRGGEHRLSDALDSTRRRLPSLFRSHFGDRRGLVVEARGSVDFVRVLRRLLADRWLDADLVLRYLRFVLSVAARARGRRGTLENLLACLGAVWRQYDFTRYDVLAWRSRGVATLYTIGMEGPFDALSMARSLVPFSTDDLFNRPDDIRAACRVAEDFFVALGELVSAMTGVPRFAFACHRTSNDFISPTHFRELALPSMRRIAEQLAARQIVTVFHCDGCWDLNLPHLAGLPEGHCVFQFDGRTDMRLARRTLGEGHCLFGDVPAALLVSGEPSEVAAYCRDLIRDVGAGGRFILAAGCEVPPNARPENVRAMLRAPLEA